MSRPHSPDCAKADPGSLCDCDCAGSQHAVARTVGNRPAAGRVSRRAAIHARAQGRAPHVGTGWTKADDTAPPPPPGRRVPRTPRAKTERVAVSSRPPRVSPTLDAKIRAVRDALPKDRSGWNTVSKVGADPEKVKRLLAQQDDLSLQAGEYGSAAFARFREIQFALQAKNKKLSQDDAEAQAEKHPDVLALYAKRDAANEARSRLYNEITQAGGRVPTDRGTGMAVPSPALDAHLDTVVDVGRQVLAEMRTLVASDPQATAARNRLDRREKLRELQGQGRAARAKLTAGLPASIGGVPVASQSELFRVRSRLEDDYTDVFANRYSDDDVKADRVLVARRERDVLMQVLGSARDFGGAHHTQAVAAQADSIGDGGHGGGPARTDWRDRLDAAGQFFPARWLARSSQEPLTVVASDRAYYREQNNTLSMPTTKRDKLAYDGSFADYTEETNVHELGHRMEQVIPGLTHLEFALVRRRARRPDGSMQPIAPIPGYKDKKEVAQPDEWADAYTGKTYEQGSRAGAENTSWEAFQVGLQDTLGRGGHRYGDDDGLLQAFVIGAMLTLGG